MHCKSQLGPMVFAQVARRRLCVLDLTCRGNALVQQSHAAENMSLCCATTTNATVFVLIFSFCPFCQGFEESHVAWIDFIVNWTIVFVDFSVCRVSWNDAGALTRGTLCCRSLAENAVIGTLPSSLSQLIALTHL